uniref:TIL domain-containing protein n=1 Tax=Rhabditophanes sp. KR3021 TaxID=114890 RepID=A0AC35U148_9BILA
MNCTGNTVYLECGTCERTCGVSSFICTMECKRPGCYCLGNFARDGPNGTCIPDTKCKNAVLNSTLSGTTEPTIIGDYKCAANLTYTDCGACESTCADPLNICPSSCKPKGCYCSGGYVRTGNSNSTCISYLDCPNSTPQSMETFFIMANPEALREARKAKEAHHIQMGIAIGEPNPNTAA